MEKNYKINQKIFFITIKFLIVSCFIFLFFGIIPTITQAANLYFSPSSGAHTVGKTFSTSIYVSSTDNAINAISGVISFPSDKLQIVSISKTNSIINLWVQEPSFSNSLGTINIEGIVLNPGFIGSSGKIITINFKIKTIGSAFLSFSSASVLANDGQGTNLLTNFGSANFALNGVASLVPDATTPAEIIGTPSAPIISSFTHPDPNKWYALSDAKFDWNISSDIDSARLLVGKIPKSIPNITYSPAINTKDIPELSDGIWYFHVRLKNSFGWGDISHFRFQIDTERPDHFDIKEIQRNDSTDPQAKFIFDASDVLSGIDHYEIQIDSESPQIWQDNGSGIYKTSVLRPGNHTLIAKAVDKAGNSLANSAEFKIEALETPIITEYPKQLQSEEIFTVKGTTYPNIKVDIWLQIKNEDAKNYTIESDKNGDFTFIADEKLDNGVYKMWAEAVDKRGARSEPTEKATIIVRLPAFLRIGSFVVSLLSVVIPFIALIILLILLAWYAWHRFSSLKRRIRKEVNETEEALHKAFNLLKEGTKEEIKFLKKVKTARELTKEEKRVIKNLMKDLDDAEKYIRKEVRDIKKEVN